MPVFSGLHQAFVVDINIFHCFLCRYSKPESQKTASNKQNKTFHKQVKTQNFPPISLKRANTEGKSPPNPQVDERECICSLIKEIIKSKTEVIHLCFAP